MEAQKQDRRNEIVQQKRAATGLIGESDDEG
jgi:hypothetical protein